VRRARHRRVAEEPHRRVLGHGSAGASRIGNVGYCDRDPPAPATYTSERRSGEVLVDMWKECASQGLNRIDLAGI
jgi:hypothetical protein